MDERRPSFPVPERSWWARFRALPTAAQAGVVAGGIVVVVVLVALFGQELFVRVSPFRLRVLNARTEEGGPVTLRWRSTAENRRRYPFERVYVCPVQRGRTVFRACALVLAATPNDGQETVTMSRPPGTYRILLQALGSNRLPVRGIRLTSNGFRVIPRSPESESGGGTGGGNGGGAPPPQPPPPPAHGGHGGVPPPPPPHG